MNFKKRKEDVLAEIQANASGAAYSQLSSSLGYSMKIDANSVTSAIQMAIGAAVAEGFRTLLANQYTDDDFEKDLTLKS